jgi:hypothetical protein
MKKTKRVLVFLVCLACLVYLASVALADDTSGNINIQGAVEIVMTGEQDIAVNVKLALDQATGQYQANYDSSSFLSSASGHVLLEGPASTSFTVSAPATVDFGDASISVACKYDQNGYNDAGSDCTGSLQLSDSGNGYISIVPQSVSYTDTNNEIGTKTSSYVVTINWD